MILGGSYLQGLLFLLFPLQHLPGGPSPSLDRRLSATAGGTSLKSSDRPRTHRYGHGRTKEKSPYLGSYHYLSF